MRTVSNNSSLNLLPYDGQERTEDEHTSQRPRNESRNFFRNNSGDVNNIQRQSSVNFLNNHHNGANPTHRNIVITSQSSQIRTKYCYDNSWLLLGLITVGVFSTALSGYVLHIILTTDCQCSPSMNYNRSSIAIDHDKLPQVLDDLTTKLEEDIWSLQADMGNFSGISKNKLECDKDCGKQSAKGFTEAYQETVEQLERLYNNIEEMIERRLQRTNEKLQGIEEEPNCLLNQKDSRENGTLITITVPKSTKNRKTVGVTCTTTLQHTADVRYMASTSKHKDVYTCYCTNRIKKLTDCVAYFWQCKF